MDKGDRREGTTTQKAAGWSSPTPAVGGPDNWGAAAWHPGAEEDLGRRELPGEAGKWLLGRGARAPRGVPVGCAYIEG